MSTINLGDKRGALLVFGGVYSNFRALEALKQIADDKKIEPGNILCTGDIVAYCAQPEECVQSIKQWGINCIAGNVELQLGAGEADCACDFTKGGRCDTFSRQWYPYAQMQLSEDSLVWMRSLPEFIMFQYAGHSVCMLHGSYHNTSEFIFESTDWSIKQSNFDDAGSTVILSGHCGLPFSQTRDGLHWLNAGVIGMPANDATPRVWYMILDDDHKKLRYQHCAMDYNHSLASQLMNEKGLTPAYASTLKTGLWDNMEILPPQEATRQGIPL
jgi:predicted phosphodiesterase